MKKAVLWDFGGVIVSSPFEAFNQYEAAHGIPSGFIRSLNATNPDTNAWARFERSELTPEQFDVVFAEESAAAGHRIPGADVLTSLGGSIHDDMLEMFEQVKAAGHKTACLTNNVVMPERQQQSPVSSRVAEIFQRFDHVVESSKVGVRKPDVRFYEIACELLEVHPTECIFLDDLGVNLKPAKAMGMTTIKVVSPSQAIAELRQHLGWN